MRKIVACLAMMIMVAACVKSDPAFVNFDSGVQNPFTFTAAGGSQSIGIQSNAAWTVSVDGSWL
ncbi:MAG: BACON domain-containing protein, partial [Bacteroidales bacterium]|nr:BACON domain-containing protein [Bacteroidales bacterium]